MDFVSDGLCDGRKLRCLTIVDDCSRECPAIEVDTSITGRRVVAVLDRLADLRGLPLSITVDHGPEFEGQVLDEWAYRRGVQLNFIRPRHHRNLADRIQHRATPQLIGRSDPGGVCSHAAPGASPVLRTRDCTAGEDLDEHRREVQNLTADSSRERY